MKFYNERARKWGESYLNKHRWRISAMYDMNDIRQDAFAVYLSVYRRHPKCGEEDLLRIYKQRIRGRLYNRSKQCFPNSYAYVQGQGKLVLNIDDVQWLSSNSSEPEAYLDCLSDVLVKLPEELAKVLNLLVRDFMGVTCIEQRSGRRLSGKHRVEPMNTAIARVLQMDRSRDVFVELDSALGIKPSVDN
jgi:hypothetical protein